MIDVDVFLRVRMFSPIPMSQILVVLLYSKREKPLLLVPPVGMDDVYMSKDRCFLCILFDKISLSWISGALALIAAELPLKAGVRCCGVD
jgi:hypothetical protein